MKRFALIFPMMVALVQDLPAADVLAYGVAKAVRYAQVPGGSPAVLGSNACTFQALVMGVTNGVVTNATVKPSNSTPARQLTGDATGTLWRFEESFNSQSALDAVYPSPPGVNSASYTVTMQTVNDGQRAVSVNFWLLQPIVAASYPSTPTVNNLAAGQAIDSDADFTLEFRATGSALTILQLLITDTSSNLVFSTPAPTLPGALNGAATSVVIPAGTLPSNTVLEAHLTAANAGLPNTSGYPDATGLATLARETAFPMVTIPRPVPPSLELLDVWPVTTLRASPLQTNRTYRLETSANLAVWTEVASTNTSASTVDFKDPSAPGAVRFYRLRGSL